MKYVAIIFLALFGMIEFIFRFALVLVLIASIWGLFAIIMGDLKIESILRPHLFTLIKDVLYEDGSNGRLARSYT